VRSSRKLSSEINVVAVGAKLMRGVCQGRQLKKQEVDQ
jgi:hypothetical protein